MNFLLTNDDGIHAPGLWIAAGVLARLGKVTIIAPVRNYSGYGPAHPAVNTLTCTSFQHDECTGPPNVTAYALSSTPAACVHVGLSGVLTDTAFDVVISGINDALNLGRDVLYSGTVGAALTAHIMGTAAIALSLDATQGGVCQWHSAAWALEQTIGIWQEQHHRSRRILNVNIPNLARTDIKGAITTFLGSTSFLSTYSYDRDPHDPSIITAFAQPLAASNVHEPWSDAWAVRNGFVSVTPLDLFPDIVAETVDRRFIQEMNTLSSPVPASAFSLAQ